MTRKLSTIVAALVVVFGALTPYTAHAATAFDFATVPQRTQMSIVSADGSSDGTSNEHEPRPALSLSKLYLGYWVLTNGSEADRDRIYTMIRYSDDAIATELDNRYPQAIASVIRQFGLSDSVYSGYWGTSSTSTYDIASFVSEIRYQAVAQPLIDGMVNAAPIAADGYPQNYGTSHLPGAQGTKYGWSNDHTINATVTIGDGWVTAANTWGSADQLTSDVMAATTLNEATEAVGDEDSVDAAVADIAAAAAIAGLSSESANTGSARLPSSTSGVEPDGQVFTEGSGEPEQVVPEAMETAGAVGVVDGLLLPAH